MEDKLKPTGEDTDDTPNAAEKLLIHHERHPTLVEADRPPDPSRHSFSSGGR